MRKGSPGRRSRRDAVHPRRDAQPPRRRSQRPAVSHAHVHPPQQGHLHGRGLHPPRPHPGLDEHPRGRPFAARAPGTRRMPRGPAQGHPCPSRPRAGRQWSRPCTRRTSGWPRSWTGWPRRSSPWLHRRWRSCGRHSLRPRGTRRHDDGDARDLCPDASIRRRDRRGQPGPFHRGRGDFRAPRAQRRGKDHDDQDAHHAPAPLVGERPHRRLRCRQAVPGGAPADRLRAADAVRGRDPQRLREPSHLRPACTSCRAARAGSASARRWSSWASPIRRTSWCASTREA